MKQYKTINFIYHLIFTTIIIYSLFKLDLSYTGYLIFIDYNIAILIRYLFKTDSLKQNNIIIITIVDIIIALVISQL